MRVAIVLFKKRDGDKSKDDGFIGQNGRKEFLSCSLIIFKENFFKISSEAKEKYFYSKSFGLESFAAGEFKF